MDLIDRQEVLAETGKWLNDLLEDDSSADIRVGIRMVRVYMKQMSAVQSEPLSDAYMKAVWTWLLNYQIKVAELQGRYTPYEVLSWVANDWRKEHDGSD